MPSMGDRSPDCTVGSAGSVDKYLAVLFLKDQDPFVIIDGVFELHYLENRGAAFGIMQGQQVFFLVIALVVLLAVVYLFCKMSKDAEVCTASC